MPRARRPEYDSEEFARRYTSAEPLRTIAEWLGVSIVAVHRAGERRGLVKGW
jgi:Zn-dependent peptidase ImmA (M78 family)